ncbi:aspartate aminotransferase family protein [Kordiimonas sediminis]|uniref:Aspartate aminotransferase family protein n=1 Tax=Kordiimonas sediminis TaxID=1735581 RepID=A0A919AQR5_9PROT|nr:aminotransferase class III-fold pyridoxal phosphate-dependent enzyme [Kordiimonas sediminis]GHF20616.1 aspartate aminotransferase family protein [Kordiimonas sediminis]
MTDMSKMNNRLDAFWMPFTPNAAFKANPRLMQFASGFYYTTTEGRQILDGFSGLWCSGIGHGHPKITEAIQKQAAEMDYSSPFNFGHPKAFELAEVIANQFPGDLDHVFFTNSGSESVDTALKMAIGYHRMRGEGSRTRLIGRVNGYHGVGFGGISVGGMVNNRKFFGSLLPGTDHMPFPYDPTVSAFTRGEPTEDPMKYLAELETMITLHDPSTIAAVIVEPVVGSAGMFVPPKGYLKRLRDITKKHGILLICDEVITGFGRLGTPNAATYFGVEPDIITLAKGINNAAVPMGAVVAGKHVYDAFINGTQAGVEFFHGYTYSAHPLAVASGLAAQAVYKEEGVYENVQAKAAYFEEAVHSLKGEPFVEDVRNIGFAAGLTITQDGDKIGARAAAVFQATYDNGVMVRANGNTIAIAPILTSTEVEIDRIVDAVKKAVNTVS